MMELLLFEFLHVSSSRYVQPMYSWHAGGTRSRHRNSFRLRARRNEMERGESWIGVCRCNYKQKCISWKRNREFNIYSIVNSRTVPTSPSGSGV